MKKYLVSTALTVASIGALAQGTTFDFTLSGSGIDLRNPYQCPGEVCDPQTFSGALAGMASITISGSGSSGTYSDYAGLLDISINGSFGGGGYVEYDLASEQELNDVAVAVTNGQVISISGSIGEPPSNTSYNPYYTYIVFNGLNFTYDFSGAHHADTISAIGAIAAIPEPASWVLVASGLFLVASRLNWTSAQREVV